MIKIVFCLRRKAGMTPLAFQDYWLARHAPLVAERAQHLGIRRYVQSHTVFDSNLSNLASVRGFAGEPFDGVAELWFDSVSVLYPNTNVPEASVQAARDLLADESEFIDLENSPIFVAVEREIIALRSPGHGQ